MLRYSCVIALLMCVLASLGMGRIWVSVQATQTAQEAGKLRVAIESERYTGEMLEVKQSVLGSPARIRAVAAQTMDLVPATHVTYLDMKDQAPQVAAGSLEATGVLTGAQTLAENTDATSAGLQNGGRLKNALASLARLTAGEAQILLVGDVGIAQAK